jgi:hypothetical protein
MKFSFFKNFAGLVALVLAYYAIGILITFLVLPRSAWPAAPCGQDMSSTRCTADSPISLSSFAVQSGVLLNQITSARESALKALLAHSISKPQAIALQSRADAARALVTRAIVICAPLANGDCADKAAMTLLMQARATLSASLEDLEIAPEK